MFVKFFFFLALAFTCLFAKEVIDLDSKNFEHLTQVSTGATTGDWLVKFYAPWCGHCRKMEGALEETAVELKGTVNVARVDVPANRDLGSRFEVQGFPTILFFSKGQVFKYEGKRTKNDMVEFARRGYKKVDGEKVPEALGFFSQYTNEFTQIFSIAYKQAMKDIKNKKYFTADTVVLAMPIILVLSFTIICLFTPNGNQYDKRKKD